MQNTCGAAKIGNEIRKTWAGIESDSGNLDDSMEMFRTQKATLVTEPAQSMAGAMVKFLMVRDTMDDVCASIGKHSPCRRELADAVRMFDDAISVLEVHSGITAKSLGLDMFHTSCPHTM